MDYKGLIETIQEICKMRGISIYQLAQISSVPISTLYGVFHYKNKAQIDTLFEILTALDMQLSIIPLENGDNKNLITTETAWLRQIQELSFEKRALLKALVNYLKD